MSFDLLQYLFSLGLLYVYGRTMLHYGLIFIHFMLDQRTIWKSKFEKPRILFLLTGTVFMHLMLYANETLTAGNYLLRIIVITVFAISLFLSHFVWTDRFESNLLIQKKLVPQEREK